MEGVSVIIPTRNRAALLRQALHSALAQTHPVHEVIVVDDGSNDHTQKAVSEFRDVRVRYLRLPSRQGAPAARNIGVRAATGRFVAFLDDDDQWLRTKIERQLAALEDADAVICGALRGGAPARRRRDRMVGGADLRRGFEFGGGSSSVMLRAEVARRFPFDESLPCGQDWDLVIRLASSCRVRFIAEPLVLYNAGSHPRLTNTSAVLPLAELHARRAVLRKHREFLGPFWYNYHSARFLLSNFKDRPKKWRHVRYTARTCGWSATFPVLVGKFTRAVESGRLARGFRNRTG